MRGSLLVEVIIAAFLLFVGGLAILRTFPVSHRYATISEHQLAASRFGAGLLAELQRLGAADSETLGPLRKRELNLAGANEGAPTTVRFQVESIRFRYGGDLPDSRRVAEVATVVVAWHEGSLAGGDAAGDKRVSVSGGIALAP